MTDKERLAIQEQRIMALEARVAADDARFAALESTIHTLEGAVQEATKVTEEGAGTAGSKLVGPRRDYYSLPQACAARNINYKSITASRDRLPNGGTPDFMIGNRAYWRAATIEAWDPCPRTPTLPERKRSA